MSAGAPIHPNRDSMSEETKVTIKANRDGPYIVRGPATILDVDGEEWDVTGKKSVALCRCGASLTKPFCDGTHSKVGFRAAEQAVRESGDV
jgi:CDGSH-type Zn-finger protein